jgi:hypothetical protein
VGFDQLILRGGPEREHFSLFNLKRTIDAVLSVNDGRSGRHSRELIRRRVQVDSAALSDPTSDLQERARRKSNRKPGTTREDYDHQPAP